MRGVILNYSKGGGLISGQDGNRYMFSRRDWVGQGEPSAGIEIDFIAEQAIAKNVFPLRLSSKHSKVVLAIVCWFFGMLGIHRFMVGKTGTGILMLILTITIIGALISSIWMIVDFIYILLGKFTDKDGYPIDNEFV